MAIKMYEVQPDYMTTPGKILRDTIRSKNLTQEQAAENLGTSAKNLSNIINNKVSITPEMALKLEYVLETPASFWNNLAKNYQEYNESKKQDETISKEKEWLKKINYADLANKGFVPKTRKQQEKLKNLLKFFGYPTFKIMQTSMDNDKLLAGAYRISTNQGTINKYALKAWIQAGNLKANKINTDPFSRTALKKVVPQLRELNLQNDPQTFIPSMQKILSTAGVAVVFVPEVKGSRISGLTRWLPSNSTAVIELSLRYKTNDHLWFTFFHEIAHLLLHQRQPFFSMTKVYDEDPKESEADNWAANELIPRKQWDQFISDNQFDEKNIIAFANQIKIHPGIVVGRLQKEQLLSFKSHYNKLKVHYKWTI
ncbi:MAG: HigA family addiction module antitoxin [Lentilactobacillus diolivorans]|uniref:HigA family addiction module antitoxin n=1 Tax=Lentilactobacillus diolivorans TaxID=179838 RepID=UPI0039E887A3